MSKFQKIRNILYGIGMILLAIVILIVPEYGASFVALILGITFFFRGLHFVSFYFTMARFMVGGKKMLFQGIIFVDLGALTLSLTNIPQQYIMLYLIAGYLFNGVVTILKTVEAKKLKSRVWKRSLARGIVNIGLAAACICCFGMERMMVIIFVVGMIYNALVRIISVFRRNAVVYVGV